MRRDDEGCRQFVELFRRFDGANIVVAEAAQPTGLPRLPNLRTGALRGPEKEAVEEPYENITYFFRRHAELTRSGLGRADTGPGDRRRARVEKLDQLSYDEILQTRVAFGTAAGLVDRLGQLQKELGLTGLVAELNPGGLLSMERMRRTLRILTHEVIPALK